MNVLHVNMSLDLVTGGGTVERIRQLHTAISEIEGVSSRVLSLATSESPALSKSKDVELLPCWSRRWYLPAPKLLAIYRMVREADVIHLMNHWTLINAVVYWIARMTGTPYVICPAGALSLFGRSQGFKRCYNSLVGNDLVKNSAAAIVIAEDEIALLKQHGVLLEHIHHIPNGVSLGDFSYCDDQLFRQHASIGDVDYLLFVGRLNEIKGPDLLLDAFIALSFDFPKLHLVFLGPDGGMLEELKSSSAKAELDSRVHFTGYAGGDLKSSAYHGASLLVVPSRQEAMSIVALEGAVCSLPVVLTERCGFDALSEAGAAKLVDANSHAILSVIAELMADVDLRNAMGVKGQQLAVNSYTWEKAAHKHLELFSQCVDDLNTLIK